MTMSVRTTTRIPLRSESERRSKTRKFDTPCGLRDGQHEIGRVVNFSWVHTFNRDAVVTVSPFYHYNDANYDSPGSTPGWPRPITGRQPMPGASNFNDFICREIIHRSVSTRFGQNDSEFFGLISNDGSFTAPSGKWTLVLAG